MKNLTRIGIYMSKLLRHNSENLKINKEGYVLVEDLLHKLNISKEELDNIVETNNKKRFEYSDDNCYIKARQGHSNKNITNLELKELTINDNINFLYHGTSSEYSESIIKNGLSPMNRQHVHWTKDIDLATKRSLQKTKYDFKNVICILNVMKFLKDGNKIYVSNNDVYLTGVVDEKYFS